MPARTCFVFSDAKKAIEDLRQQGFTKFTVVRTRRGRVTVKAIA